MKNLTLVLFVLITCTTSRSNAQNAGNSLHFDGVDDYVSCALPDVFTDISSNAFTVEMWVKQETSQFSRLFFAQDDADNFMSLSVTANNEVVFYLVDNTANNSVQSSEVFTNGDWVHIAATWDPVSQAAKLFLDGTEVSYATGVYVSSTGNDNVLTFGSRTDGAQFFSGEIDEVSVWEVVRDECEIKLDRFDKRSGNDPSLDALYIFDHGTAGASNPTADFLQDLTFGSSDGVLNGFGLSGNTSNWVSSNVQMFAFISDPQISYSFGSPTALIATIPAGDYQWINCSDSSLITGAVFASFDPALDDPNFTGAPTDYALITTIDNCVDTSECLTVQTASIEEQGMMNHLMIYPNPTAGMVKVDLPIDAQELTVLSLDGKVLVNQPVKHMTVADVDLSNLNGIYLIQVVTKSGFFSSKVIVQGN